MSNIKDQFIQYMQEKSPKDSGKPMSYARAMEILEKVFFTEAFSSSTSIWNFINSQNIDNLYAYVLQEQKKDDGLFKGVEPESYWKKSYCSASLKEFGAFLKKKSYGIQKEYSESFNILKFIIDLENSNLQLSNGIPFRYISALQTKPFVILTGLSGSGKTKLAEAFSLWITESSDQYCMVSVGADWTNREPLLGFPNALEPGRYVKPDTGVLDLLLRASNDETRPYFLILDEMNMSHVERYFADFLSAMESIEGEITLHPDGDEWMECDVPEKLKLPKNLFIIGTVNIDETTYMFSPKVLDRANVIEFRVSKDEMERYFKDNKLLNMSSLVSNGASMGRSFVEAAISDIELKDNLGKIFIPFFEELQKIGSEFGYRTASEIGRFVTVCTAMAEKEMSSDEIIDAAVMQKFLPKVHGSRNKIEKILVILGKLCIEDRSKEPFSTETINIKYPLSHEKLKRMYMRVLSDGFTSFAEA